MKNLKGQIILITGVTSSGKDETQRYLMNEYDANPIVSYTTRPMRVGEIDGVHYHFTTTEDFLNKVASGEIFEHRKYNTLINNVPNVWYYGASASEVKDDQLNVVVVDTIGVREFVEEFGKSRCVVFMVRTPHPDINRKLCITRGDYDKVEFERRLADDNKKFNVGFVNKYVDHFINNPCTSLGELKVEIDMVMED